MGAKWGVNRSVVQIRSLLHIAPEPLTDEDICDTLTLARSNEVSPDTCLLQFALSGLIVNGRQHVVVRVLALCGAGFGGVYQLLTRNTERGPT